MSNTDYDLLKASLEAKLSTIGRGADKRADLVIQQAPDALDQTQFAAERDLTVSLLHHDSEMVRRVRGALRRMDDHSYGICLACEGPISPKRLRALPWAELCLGCQEQSDLMGLGVVGADEQNIEIQVADLAAARWSSRVTAQLERRTMSSTVLVRDRLPSAIT